MSILLSIRKETGGIFKGLNAVLQIQKLQEFGGGYSTVQYSTERMDTGHPYQLQLPVSDFWRQRCLWLEV